MRRRIGRGLLAAFVAAAGVQAASAEEFPAAVEPLRVEPDINGVNLTTGQIAIPLPVLSVPAAPNLRFERIQTATPIAKGKNVGQGGDGALVNYSVDTGSGASEAFRCDALTCASVNGTGSVLGAGAFLEQVGSGIRWNFTTVGHNTTTQAGGTVTRYATTALHPNGETISYSYQFGTDGLNRKWYRPTVISSNVGYHISISYQSDTFGDVGWNAPSQAGLYRSGSPAVLLRRFTYSGGTITDWGNNATNVGGRAYTCTGCNNSLGSKTEVSAGSMQLPGEASASLTVTRTAQTATIPSTNGTKTNVELIGTVTRDGVSWNYTYSGLTYEVARGYWYSGVTVTGPDGYRRVYAMTQSEGANRLTGITETVTADTTRSTQYRYAPSGQPDQITYPEQNRVNVAHDEYGNIVSRTATPKPASGLTAVTETAFVDTATCAGARYVLCYRPTSSTDGLNRRTDYAYDSTTGQLTEQTDPADSSGIRRRTRITYAPSSSGISRREVVRVCGTGAACDSTAEIRTEYDYSGNTFLPSVERRIDSARGVTLTTTYVYDAAGRVLTADGPLPGTGDATYRRYDRFGRLVREVGPLGANNVRLVQLHTYRDSDDKVTRTETATLLNPDDSPTVLSRVDYAYDARRNPVREATVSGTMTYALLHRTFDLRNRLQCEARRMNPAVFSNVTTNACALGAAGTGADDFGPDRITRNSYDLAGQLLEVEQAYGTPLQQTYATYTYSSNGRRTSVTDANGNRAVMCYDGFDRQSRWMFLAQVADCGRAPLASDDYEGYGYDRVGNRTSLRKRDGPNLTYHYDALDRMTNKIVPPRTGLAATHTRDVFYDYNVLDLQTFARFDSASGEGITNGYDAFGRLLSSTSNMDGVSRAVTRSRDDVANRTYVTYGGQTYVYDYDDASRLEGVYQGNTVTATALLTGFTYTPRGQVDLRNGKVSSVDYDYDAIGRLTSMAHAFAGGAGNVTFGLPLYNPASQIERRTRSNPGSSPGQADAYAWNGGVEVNRAYTVNALNQYTAAGTTAFGYDRNGNLTSSGSTTYVYDVENRLVAASGGQTANLRYDPLGRLYEVGAATPSRRLLWDGDALVAEYQITGALAARFVHGATEGVDDPLIWFGGGENRRLHTNHQGSVVAITNGSGAQTWLNAYDEWGIPNMTAGAPANTGRFQYTGQIWIGELGMYHYKARIYSPTLGRFLQVDPVGYDDQVNLYAYVGNDPVNHTDPDGKTCTPSGQGGTYVCRIDKVAILSRDGQRVIGTREPTAREERSFAAFNQRYSDAVNNLMRNPERAASVDAVQDGQGSFQTTAEKAGRALISRQFVYAGRQSGNRAMGTAGGPGADGQPARTYVRNIGLRSDMSRIVHEGGLHGTPEEATGGLQTARNPLNGIEHQRQYNDAACALLGNTGCE